jgi:putative SOS response-associated peptidase YedK
VAGLWSTWTGPDGKILRTCCIITTEANGTMSPIHDRMPVIVEAEDWPDWLDRRLSDRERLTEIMVPADESILRVVDVSTRVNSIRNNDPELIEAVDR